jgi:hypothetical protein
MFRDYIKTLVDRLDGGVGGVLMGFDGIAVDSYAKGGTAGGASPLPDIQSIGMEFAHLISQVRAGARSLELGLLNELTLRTERLTILVQILNQNYFVACAVLPTGNPGKARYLLRMTIPQIEAEL